MALKESRSKMKRREIREEMRGETTQGSQFANFNEERILSTLSTKNTHPLKIGWDKAGRFQYAKCSI